MQKDEGTGVPAGSYVAAFSSFQRNNSGSFFFPTKNGPTIRYVLKVDNAKVQPVGSFYTDPDHYSMNVALGAMGVPGEIARKGLSGNNKQQHAFLVKLEKRLKDIGATVSAWVPDSGWIGSLRPYEGHFNVRFVRITSRSSKEEGDEPVHIYKTGTRQSARGSYPYEEHVFNTVLEVEGGPHHGSAFTYQLHYRITFSQEKSDWVLDVKGRRGKQFYEFFSYHGIRLENLDPESGKFADPANMLPELEPILLKKRTMLSIEVKDGWIEKLSRVAETASPDEIFADLVGVDQQKGRKKRRRKKLSSKEPSTHLVMLRNFINKEFGQPVYDMDDQGCALPGKEKRALRKLKLPMKSLVKYSPKELKAAILKLGYGGLINEW